MDKDKCRVIKIGKDALWEFVFESVIDRQEDFFDVDRLGISSHFDINFSTGELIFLIHKAEDENGKTIQPPAELDLKKLLKHMKDTTSTMYQSNRYVELSLSQIVDIQSGKDNGYTK